MPLIIDIASSNPNSFVGDTTIPHFAYPFAITAAGAAVAPQNSTTEVFACIQAIAACPTGTRLELPSFGVPAVEFSNAPVDIAAFRAAFGRWEPRAATTITEYGDLANPAVRHVHIDVEATP